MLLLDIARIAFVGPLKLILLTKQCAASSSSAASAPAAAAPSPPPSAAAHAMRQLRWVDAQDVVRELPLRGEEPRQLEHELPRLMEDMHLQEDEPRLTDHDPQQPENEQQLQQQRREDMRLQGELQGGDEEGLVLSSSREGATEGSGALHPTLSPQQRRAAMIE